MKRTLAAAALALLATNASAHSPLEATTPPDGAALTDFPSEITLTFKRNMRLTRVTLTHADEHSDQLDLEDQTNFATEFSLPFEGNRSGVYVIEWRGLGDDGHPQHGTFTFTVK